MTPINIDFPISEAWRHQTDKQINTFSGYVLEPPQQKTTSANK